MRPIGISSAISAMIAEDVAGDHDIELLGPSDELHGGVVDVHVGEFDVGEFLGDGFGDDIAPELGDVEDVGLVNAAEFAASFAGDVTYWMSCVDDGIATTNSGSVRLETQHCRNVK